MIKNNQNYVIGVDGGGTKTVAALADLEGKILKIGKSGPASFIKVGVKETVLNVAEAIEGILKKNKKIRIISTFIALAAIEENKEMRRVIMKNLLLQSKISQIFKGKVTIGSDQIAGFRAGTNKKEGVVLVSGTGSAAHGWRKRKEAHASGWGWLADEGSAFWVGQRSYRAVLKDLDGRALKTLMTNLFLKKFNAKSAGDLKRKVYIGNSLIENVSSLAILVNEAAQKGDKTAKNILVEAGKELALAANTVIKKLNFKNENFSLVLVGSMFKSKVVLDTVKREIKKIAPKAEFILPKQEPVTGAIKLALEQLKRF
jgi:N-acetylglucosamine kinase-like BadF-type ATPase